MLDGYNEYTPGTNKDIDAAVRSGIGNCYLILTSQPDYLSKRIRDTMDAEIFIEGFSEESIRDYSTKYLATKEKSDEMLNRAKEAGIYELLETPIILLMVTAIFTEESSLPTSKTGIYDTIFRRIKDSKS